MVMSSMARLVWTLLFAPMAACVVIALFARKSKTASAGLAIGAMAVSFLCAVGLLVSLLGHHIPHEGFQSAISWITMPNLSLDFGLLVNPLSIVMSLVVTGVGLMIFIYSAGYMAEDRSFSRYFAYLSLFAFSMLGIVLAHNFIGLFMFWELVGASSYLLIGFWYDKPSAANAGKKAFIVNRIADFGFIVGILMLWVYSGLSGEVRTLDFILLEGRFEHFVAAGLHVPATLTILGVLIFCGVVGKSAQFPLHVWLPDAMEGPTPVSAMLHAATMVAAGVYMLCRVFFLYVDAPLALQLIGWVGGFTSIFAASMALVENDIKRVLAYSTLSQLGYMVMAVGLGGYTAGMYHLTTHAFFKALLFLGAGCVIHALHTNDIWHMGGLRKSMPITSTTFFIGSLALCGIFPLSGFWSKDEILALAFEHNRALWIIGTLTAGMTAFYMGRVLCVAFLGKPRDPHHHAHEAPAMMTGPLIPLAILSVIGGFIGIPSLLHHERGVHVEFNLLVAIISSAVAAGGLAIAYAIYGRETETLPALPGPLRTASNLLRQKYYLDEIYSWINRNVQQRLAIFLGWFERTIIMGFMVNGVAQITAFIGDMLRRFQTGKVQTYAVSLTIGVAILLYVGWRWVP